MAGEQPVIEEMILLGTNRAVVTPADLLDAMERTRNGKAYRGQLALDLDAEVIERMYRERLGRIVPEISYLDADLSF